MNFRDLELKRSYISFGDDNIAKAFISPLLHHTKTYKRSVGFFSSSALKSVLDGVVALARNNGKIQLIASPQLTQKDVDAINTGYEAREKIINDCFSINFIEQISEFDDNELNLLSELIARNVLDIKIAVTDTVGIYHDKLGIFEDNDGNKIVFYGSANSSENAYLNNYEKIRVVTSWKDGEADSVNDEIKEFDDLWNARNKYVKIYDYKESARCCILNVIEERAVSSGKKAPIKLRDYQEEAINAWKQNGFHGFYVMATGTGKTWTAIFSAKELIKDHPAMVVICAPYKHLVKQWAEDVEKVFENAKIILVSSENPKWEQQITQEIIRKQYNQNNQIIIISTIASFKMERFINAIQKSKDEKLLIVDEAHRFTERPDNLREMFQYMLGLSATPYSGTSAIKGKELMSFFGGQVFNLPIEIALQKGFLVPYYYHPIYLETTNDEEQKFQYHTKRIIGCFKNNVCVNPELLVKSLRNRLRVISMASQKQEKIDQIILNIKEKDHFVVYCGDGHLFDNNTGEELRHIKSVRIALDRHGYKSSQFTAQENMAERMELVSAFNNGEISSLVAIRCLDEGINIPSIKSALILSSNDDYREFVQRRGRILRTYPGKKYAHIYDIIVLPSTDVPGWAKIELRRFHEYAKLALNWDELKDELEENLNQYNLTIEDVDVYDYEDMEDTIDE